MAQPWTPKDQADWNAFALKYGTQPAPGAPIEIPPIVIGPESKGWMPSDPVAGSTAELMAAPAVAEPATQPSNPIMAAAMAPPPAPTTPAAASPALLPQAPVVEDIGGNDASNAFETPQQAAVRAKAMGFASAPVPVASPAAPKPASSPGPAPSAAPRGPMDFLTPAERERFALTKEGRQWDEIWGAAQADVYAEGKQQAHALFDQSIAADESFAEKEQQIAARYDQWRADDESKRSALADEIQSADISTSNYWKELGVGGTVMAGLAVALGAMGAPATGGRNVAAESIDKAIDRSIRTQVVNLDNKKDALRAKQSEYAMRVAMFKDEKIARESMRADANRLVAKQIESVAMQTADEAQKIELIAMQDEFDTKANLADNDVRLLIEDRIRKQQEAASKALGAARGDMAKRDKQVFDASLRVAEKRATELGGSVDLVREPVVFNGHTLAPGTPVVVKGGQIVDVGTAAAAGGGETVNLPVPQAGGGVAYNTVPVAKGSHAAVAKQVSGYTKAIQAIDRLEKAASMPGPWEGEKLKDYESAMSDYVSAYAAANDMGVVSDVEGKRIAKTVAPTPTRDIGYLSDAEKSLFDKQKKALAAQAAGLATAYGTPDTAGPAPIVSAGAPVKQK